MSNSIREQVSQDFQKVKETGSTKASRIRDIFQTAATQAMAEVKDGSGAIRAIAQHSVSNMVDSLNGTSDVSEVAATAETVEISDQTVHELPQKSASVNLKTIALAVVQAIKTRLAVQFQKERADLQVQFVSLKHRVAQVDEKLVDRYGVRYVTAKQRLNDATVWYNSAVVNAEAEGTTALQEKQVELEGKAASWGSSTGRKEQQVRQQLKQFLQITADKL